MAEKLNWGILGTGRIAKTFATGVGRSRTGRVVAVASRARDKAEQFGQELSIPTRHGSYEALLADEQVQAVYIATPHPMHAEWAVKAANAKKHLLVEKPIGINHAEAMVILEAARRNDVFCAEAFMYRCHRQIAKLVELIQNKAIGEVRVIQATFSFHAPKPFTADHRLTSNDLGGGGILDVGCYTTSLARLIAGVAMGKDFENPTEVKAVGHLESTGVDGYTIACLKFPGEILAQCATGVQLNQENIVRIFGSEGNMVLPEPWIPAREGGKVRIIVNRAGKPTEEIAIESDQYLYGLEADMVAENIARRQPAFPAANWADTLGNMKTLDRWRQQIGVIYQSEPLANLKRPAYLGGLSRRAGHNMKYGRIKGVDKPVSRLGVGAVFAGGNPREAMGVFDDAFERGVNFFDTARIYGSDKILGHWVTSRGVREQVVILGKGVHPPFTSLEDLTRQLKETLEESGLEYLDLYMMHRDNQAIGVGEYIDLLNEHKAAGLIRAFGGSNWTLPRVEQANAYAGKKGVAGFSAISNNFSLARMEKPVWAGCLHNSDPESRVWFTKTQMTLVPWSSQARGFFVPGLAHPDKRDDKEMVNSWYSPDNFRRLERANQLARKRNVLPINIALAYVLNQPFPTFPFIGPVQIEETRTSLPALDIALSQEELKWLNLEE